MWRKEDGNPQSPEVSSASGNPPAGKSTNIGGSSAPTVSGKGPACVSQGIRIKGELTGSEDLFIDGNVDGKIILTNSTLTVGPNATVKADITAREVVVRGRAEGKFTATERVQIWHTARVQGDIKSERISIEDGAQMQGKLEAGKPGIFGSAEPSGQSSKKSESSKPKDSHVGEEKTTSGLANAGAD